VSTRKKTEQEGGVATDTRTRQKLARPRLYKVLLHNDDYTTMEFVVALLVHVFHHNESDAQAIMLNIHKKGMGVAGVYIYEIAESKMAQTMELAKKAEFPLLCTLEPDDAPTESPGE
jgi:ATP-dependent Clp protease adaptor protein ClpS